MADPPAIDSIIADAYRDASMRGADMRAFATEIEAARAVLLRSDTLVDSWHALNASVAALHPQQPVTSAVVALRDAVKDARLAAAAERIDAAARESETDAAAQWKRLIGDAAVALWSELLVEIGGWSASRPFLDAHLGALTAEAGTFLDASRFVDARPFLEHLAGDAILDDGVRFDLTILLAQIALFRSEDLPAVQRLLDQAAGISPGHVAITQLEADRLVKRAFWATEDADRQRFLDEAEQMQDTADQQAREQGSGSALARERRGDLLVLRAQMLQRDDQDKQSGATTPATEALANAERCYREAVELEPWDANHYSKLAAHLLRNRASLENPEVLRIIDLAKTLEPIDAADTDATVGGALLDAGQLDGAETAYRQALAAEPGNIDAIDGYGALLQARGQLDEATAMLTEADARCGGTFELARTNAWVKAVQEDYDGAIALFELALQRRPGAEALARSDLAWIYAQRGDTDRAVAEGLAACRALVAAGDHEGPLVSTASSQLLEQVDNLTKNGQLDKALEALDAVRAVRGDAFEAEFRNYRGVALHEAGRYEEATTEYLEAVRIVPDAALYWRNLSSAQRLVRRMDDAEASCQRAFELDGDEAARDNQLGLIANSRGNDAFRDGDYAVAIDQYRVASALLPDDPVVLGNLAAALIDGATKDTAEASYDEAVQLFERAVALGSTDERALEWTKRSAEVVRQLTAHVLTPRPFWRLRVLIADADAGEFADEDGNVRASILDDLAARAGELGFGLPRPTVRFELHQLVNIGTAVVLVNGIEAERVLIGDDGRAVVDAIVRIVQERAGDLIGVDSLPEIEGIDDHPELESLVDDDEAVRTFLQLVRHEARPGRQLADILPAATLSAAVT